LYTNIELYEYLIQFLIAQQLIFVSFNVFQIARDFKYKDTNARDIFVRTQTIFFILSSNYRYYRYFIVHFKFTYFI